MHSYRLEARIDCEDGQTVSAHQVTKALRDAGLNINWASLDAPREWQDGKGIAPND